MNCKFLILITVLSFSPAFLLAQWKKNILTSQSLSGVELDLNDVNTLRTPDSWPLQSAIGGNYSHWQSQTKQRYLGPIGRHDQRIIRDKKTGLPIRMEGMVDYPVRNLRTATAAEHGTSYLKAVKRTLQIDDPNEEFQLIDEHTDDLNQTHLLYQQMWQGLSVWGQEIRLHRRNGEIDLMHGRYLATPRNVTVDPSLLEQEATTKALDHLAEREVVKVFDEHMIFMAGGPQVRNTELVVYQPKNTLEPRLVWYTEVGAHALSRWAYFIDAHSGEVLNRYQMVCTMHPDLEPGHSHSIPMTKTGIKHTEHQHMVLDGPATANAIDLLGVSRTIGTYEIGSDFLLLDASRPMFNPQQSTLPDNPIGAILTLDARNKTTEDGQAFYVTSSNNTWSDAAAVSAHYNAGICYDYFRSTFGRNSINGNGGTIFSVVNISDDDGSGLDNAFWNGQFMFYGNGKEAFDPLAAALDVGAHEMTHGVIQNTANLEYQDEPGALNESFADVFGVLIDRDDWQLGEDVVRLNYFPSGALRDMQNPNNGGSRLGDPGWQPAHVDEQYRGPQDNGGVHINSGIPNRAFFLFASQVGLDRAEQVYYRVLTTYLTRTSQFFDMRMAVMQASADLYGNTEVNAAASAFDAVGITAESGNTEPDEPVDVPVNDGQQFVAMVGDNGFGLYLTDTDGTPIQGANPLVSEEIISPPSISDDGSVIVFVNGSSELRFIVIDWAEAQVVGNDVLSEERIWRRAAISKDAARIAVVTQETNDQILIYDFESQNQRTYELFNPTFTEGITSDEVQFADAMEWDITSQFLIYDAFNEVDGFGGGYSFWDIGVLEVWRNETTSFASGDISKLFTQLPRGITVGNPSVAKNSPNIIAFDYWDQNTDEFAVLGYDLQTNDVATIFNNQVIGYPTYSIDDGSILFNAVTTDNTPVIATIPLAMDKINAGGQASVFVVNRQWPIWFATGSRILTDVNEPSLEAGIPVEIFPNPVRDYLTIRTVFSSQGTVRIRVINALGQVIRQVDSPFLSGNWTYELPMNAMPSGMYRIQLDTGNESATLNVVRQ